MALLPQVFEPGRTVNVLLSSILGSCGVELAVFLVGRGMSFFRSFSCLNSFRYLASVGGYRVHKWTAADYGVEGKSSAFGMLKKESKEDGQI